MVSVLNLRSSRLRSIFRTFTSSIMVKAKVFKFAKYFNGLPKDGDLVLVEEELPPLKDGEFLAEALYLSVDPYMRAYSIGLKTGTTFIGSQVAKITESRSKKYPVGSLVVGQFGWRSHTIVTSQMETDASGLTLVSLVPDLGGLSPSLAIGVLGMPGNTSYFGFLELCQPKVGETVVVSGAAGAVGSHVGQIAKIKGCKVIGIAGSDDKGKWITKDLGFDHFINYKTQNIDDELKKLAPNGVDCYFDNVGGEIASTVLSHMNTFGRIAVCGCISSYNENGFPKVTMVQRYMISKQLKMEGFLVYRWANRYNESIQQNLQWIKEGKLKYEETVTEGFENMPKAFVEMLQGVNFGKAVVKV